MNLATLCHDENTNTWSAEYDGVVLVKSIGTESSKQYVISRILEGKCGRALKLNVTGFSNLGPTNFAPTSGTAYVPRIKPNNKLTVKDRFELLDESVRIVAEKTSRIRSLIVTGEGSVGKTFHAKKQIRALGLVSTEEAIKIAYTLTPEEQEVADKLLARMKECKEIAEAYYKANPPVKKEASAESDDEGDDEEDDRDEDEPFTLSFGDVAFNKLHNAKDIKERQCGGVFYSGTCNYAFNIKLAVKNLEEYLEIVVPHEVAHHVQSILFPKSLKVKEGHGKEWRKIMTTVFKIPSERYHRMNTDDVRHAPDLAGDYHYVKGYSSAKGLYRTLFENKAKLVVFDDCDAAWKNEVGANLLKAALDTDSERWVSWNVEGSANDDLPRSFLFSGRVIFISNVASEDFPQPLITRALRADIEMTIEERFERMKQILPSDEFAPGISMKIKKEAYQFLWDNREIAAEISSRSLLNICEVRATGSKLWKQIALSNIA